MRLRRQGRWVACVFLFVLSGCTGGAAADGGGLPAPDAAVAQDAGRDALVALVDQALARAVAQAPRDPTRCPNAVAVVVTGQHTLVRGQGVANAATSAPPDGDTVFQVGSVSKVFTGLGLARLVTDGTVQADAPVRARLAADLAEVLPPSTTFARLAAHTAGLPSMPSNLPLHDGGVDPLSPAGGYTREALRQFLQGWTPAPPAYRYSNLGSGLLGVALQDTLDGGSYHAALRTLVTGPLGMEDTWGQLAALPESARARVAEGHWAEAGRWTTGRLADMGVLAGGGEVASTGNDLARLLRALAGLEAGALAPAIALALAPLAPMSATQDIGYGIVVEHRDGGDVFLKAGNTPSSGAFLAVQRAPPLGVAVLAGCGAPFPVDDVALGLFDEVRALAP